MTSRQRTLSLPGLVMAALLVPPFLCRAQETATAAAEATVDVALPSHFFNVFLYLPLGLLAAAGCVEIFAQKQRNREIEPAILFLICCAVGAAVAGVGLAYGFSEIGKGSQGSFGTGSYALWGLMSAVFGGMAFFFKRKARDKKLFAIAPKTMAPGAVRPKSSNDKGLIIGYRVGLVAAALTSLFGLYELDLGRVKTPTLKKLAQMALEKPSQAVAKVKASDKKSEQNASLKDLLGAGKPSTEAATVVAATPPDKSPSSSSTNMVAASDPTVAPAAESPAAAPAASSSMQPMTPTAAPPVETPKMAPVIAATPSNAQLKLDPAFFARQLKPILDSKCTSCHGATKQKGDLRLDTLDAVLKGNSHPIVVIGNPDASSLYSRLVLEADDPDVMPPEGKGTLTQPQKEAFKTWILAGGKAPSEGSTAATPVLAARKGGIMEETMSQKLKAPDHAVVEKLTQGGVIIRPLSENGALLDLDFSHVESHQVDMAALSAIAENVHSLDLSRSKVKDEDLAKLGTMSNLVRLNLKGTSVSDAGMASFASLINLEWLSLVDCAGVSDTGIEHVGGLKKLQKVMLFGTKCTQASADKIKAANASAIVNVGGDLPKREAPARPAAMN